MEKLLRDLNIYAHSFMNCNLNFTHDGNRIRVQGDEIGPYVAESIILNKKFGFIKWLVENDKIDRDSEDYPIKRHGPYFDDDVLGIIQQNCNTYEDDIKKCYSDYETLLMLLAIQEQPIDFLCSILN